MSGLFLLQRRRVQLEDINHPFPAELPEELKLEFIKDIGFCHMRVLDGLDTMLQLQGLVAKLCVTAASRGARPPKK